MTTPKQAPFKLDTPYGAVEVHDRRNHESFTPGERDRVASLHFENLTINRKSYGDMIIYLAQDRRGFFGIETSSYDDLTESARRQLEEYFCDSVFPNPVLAPYKEPLPEDEWRASYKRSLALEVYRHLDEAVDPRGARRPGREDFDLRTELVDEILRDVLALRAKGKSYWNIRQERP